jgi:hypothetical protein
VTSSPRRGRGRPLSAVETNRALDLACMREHVMGQIRQLVIELDEASEVELAGYLGLDRKTVRRWKAQAGQAGSKEGS